VREGGLGSSGSAPLTEGILPQVFCTNKHIPYVFGISKQQIFLIIDC
jgi:hypothetical protein